MRRILALVVATSGCDRVFDLHPGHLPDAADAPPQDVALDGPSHDDDGDGLVDVVDPCPSDFGDLTDTDGDAVGNLCDPSALPRDHAVGFDTFATPASGWVSDSGTWQFGGDAIATAAMPGTAVIHMDVASLDHATLEVTVDPAVTVNSFVGPHLILSSGEDISCLLNIGNGNVPSIQVFYGSVVEVGLGYPGTGPIHLSLSHLASDNTFRCRARRDNQVPLDVLYALVLPTSRTIRLEVSVANTSASVSSALVLETR